MVGDKFREIYAIMPSLRGIGFKDRNFGGFLMGKGVPKTIFWPSPPHNLGLRLDPLAYPAAGLAVVKNSHIMPTDRGQPSFTLRA
jgi:hypothetical protein